MLFRSLSFLLRHTLNSVGFGISLMVAIAAYIAIGSGMPGVPRRAFEMNDLQFFSAWPLKVLMILLVANLMTVTWVRIPFTPPRYGVWCVHLGIMTLIFGMAAYYNMKVEGLAFVPVRQTIDDFYDSAERALYFRVNDVPLDEEPLPCLPRFNSYPVGSKAASRLTGADLHNIEPALNWIDKQSREPKAMKLSDQLGLTAPLKVDIIGYYPYANVVTQFIDDPSANTPALRLRMSDPHTNQAAEEWLVASDPQGSLSLLGDMEVEHRHVAHADSIDELKKVATQVHRIEAKVGDYADTMFVEPGKTYTLGDTGYSITIEEFNPAWPMFGTGEIVKALTLKVSHKLADGTTKEFRRMILDGRPLQTDFELNVPGAPPMGKRQKEPIDKDLAILYTLSDPRRLLPSQASAKRTLVTADANTLVEIATSLKAPAQVRDLPGGKGSLAIGSDAHVKVDVERNDHVRKFEHVEEVPPAKRQQSAGESGDFQVAVVRVRMGDWSQDVAVPFTQWAAQTRWGGGGSIPIPGTRAILQMQLSNRRLDMPARVTLERFDLINYPGGTPDTTSVFRDFKSTLTIEERNGNRRTAVAHLNNPVYFGGFGDSNWTLFQAQWDPNGQRWTVLGVGNRPGVWVMIAGCVMIVSGVLYAFYVKPLIIRRMKQNALANAAEDAQNRKAKTPELVTT